MSNTILKVGDVFDHPVFGKYTITDYVSSRDLTVIFHNTGSICKTRSEYIYKNKVKDSAIFRARAWDGSLVYVGKILKSHKYGNMELLSYDKGGRCKIKFLDTGNIIDSEFRAFYQGTAQDCQQQLVFGIGKSYSDKYKIREHGKKTSQYAAWENMLARCYYTKTSRFSAYGGIGVKVCDEWLVYENFAKWYDKNYVDSYHLDKDLLGNGLLYSPENCCYIPQKLNGVFVVSTKNIGKLQSHLPTGVRPQSSGYVSATHGGKNFFKTKEEAHVNYLTRKWDSVRDLATEMYRWTEITERVYQAVLDKCYLEQEPLRTVYAK